MITDVLDPKNLARSLSRIKTLDDTRIVVVWCDADTVQELLEEAAKQGIFGPESGFVDAMICGRESGRLGQRQARRAHRRPPRAIVFAGTRGS